MKRIIISLCVVFLITALISCQTNNKEELNIEKKDLLSTEKIDSNERQFICKANLEMQVKNCLATTNLIEQKVKEKRGFILKSELKKNNTNLSETVVSSDSIKQVATINTSADIILRVPDTALQTLLKDIELLGEHVKARVINKTDVSFDLKLNALNHSSGNGQTVSLSENDKPEKQILTKNESAVADLRMKDAVDFSTVKINLQQPDELVTTFVINKEASWANGDSIFTRAWYSIQKGFFILSNLLIYLIQLWWLVPLFFIGKWGYFFSKNI